LIRLLVVHGGCITFISHYPHFGGWAVCYIALLLYIFKDTKLISLFLIYTNRIFIFTLPIKITRMIIALIFS
jgi:hypothetical protein